MWLLKELASRLGVRGFYPWQDHEDLTDALLKHPSTGGISVAELRRRGGWAPLDISHVAYPDFRFHTPSGKVEFWSPRCVEMGLPPLPEYREPSETPQSQPHLARRYPLVLRPGRTITHFHSFYDQGQAVPILARANPAPLLWMHPSDAVRRGISDGDAIVVSNQRGQFKAQARVTTDALPGVVWMRSGWFGMNQVTSGQRSLPDSGADGANLLPFPVGQAAYEALVEVSLAAKGVP